MIYLIVNHLSFADERALNLQKVLALTISSDQKHLLLQ